MFTPADIDRIIDERGLRIPPDAERTISEEVAVVLAQSQKLVQDYRAGRKAAIEPIIGKVLKRLRWADASIVRAIVTRKVGAMHDPEQCVNDALRPFLVDTPGIASLPLEDSAAQAVASVGQGVDLSVNVEEVIFLGEAGPWGEG